jgi:2-keto-4-pentenoate hydratase
VPGVEAEFAFVFGRDLPPRSGGHAAEDVLAAVAGVQPVIEICDTRLAEWKTAGAEQIVADNAFYGALVLGTIVTDWRRLDLANHEAALRINGVVLGRGPGRLVLGNPLDALGWLANDLALRNIGLKAGQIVAAGSCTGLHFVTPGSVVDADFGSLGTVQINVTR